MATFAETFIPAGPRLLLKDDLVQVRVYELIESPLADRFKFVRVVAVGPGRLTFSGTLVPSDFVVGDEVLVDIGGALPIGPMADKLFVLEDSQVWGKRDLSKI